MRVSNQDAAYDAYLSAITYSQDLTDQFLIISDSSKIASKAQKSETRLILCRALATLSHYRLLEGHEIEEWDIDELKDITPPPFHKAWGSQGKPSDFVRQLSRLAESGLVELLKKNGRVVGVELTDAGVIYAYMHERLSVDDVRDYVMFKESGYSNPTTNVWYSKGSPQVRQTDFQFTTPAFSSHLLQRLKQDDSVRERYAKWSGDKLGKLVAKSFARQPVEVYGLLQVPEREALIRDVLEMVGMPASFVEDQVTGLMKGKTHKQIVARLVEVYNETHGDFLIGDAANVIDELFGRVGWTIAQRVMEFRVNDNSDQVLTAKLTGHGYAFHQSSLDEMREAIEKAREEFHKGIESMGLDKLQERFARLEAQPKPKPQPRPRIY